jgi:hypothetical protein
MDVPGKVPASPEATSVLTRVASAFHRASRAPALIIGGNLLRHNGRPAPRLLLAATEYGVTHHLPVRALPSVLPRKPYREYSPVTGTP